MPIVFEGARGEQTLDEIADLGSSLKESDKFWLVLFTPSAALRIILRALSVARSELEYTFRP
jgi:hypothetical protein